MKSQERRLCGSRRSVRETINEESMFLTLVWTHDYDCTARRIDAVLIIRTAMSRVVAVVVHENFVKI